jgi:hypothetical protein
MTDPQAEVPSVEERTDRFLRALGDLLDAGQEWEWEIEQELETRLAGRSMAGFMQRAVRCSDLLCGIVGNIFAAPGATVRIPRNDATSRPELKLVRREAAAGGAR